jgi:hypothetical protein
MVQLNTALDGYSQQWGERDDKYSFLRRDSEQVQANIAIAGQHDMSGLLIGLVHVLETVDALNEKIVYNGVK